MLSQVYLFIFLLPFIQASRICENNATYSQQADFCSCPAGFIGKNCNIAAYQLNDTEISIPITNNYTFVYFNPPEKVLYRFLLSICPVNKTQQMSIIVFAQEEQKSGQIDLLPSKPGQSDQTMIGGSKGCKQELSTILANVEKKPNQQLMRIILGFRLSNSSEALKNQSILIKCEAISIFTVNFLAIILTSFFAILGLLLIVSIIFFMRKKWMQRRAQRQEQSKKIQCVNAIMPSTKYQTLLQEKNQQIEYDVICSICLSEFEKNQDVRKTPCGHIYHSNCLESWCNSQLNCPICRKNFEQEGAIELEQTLKPDTTNIRAPIL